IITEDTFSRYEGFDLATFDAKHWPPPEHTVFRVSKHETISNFKAQVVEYFALSEQDQSRFWVLANRNNRTFRVRGTLGYIQTRIASGARDLCLYFGVNAEADLSKPYPPPGSILLFLKHFDRTQQTLRGAGTVFVQETDEVRTLELMINDKMGWREDTALKLYDASFQNQSLPLMGELTRLSVGLDIQVGYPDPIEFYNFLENRVLVVFRPKSQQKSPDFPEFAAVLSKKNTYDAIAAEASKNLQHNPAYLRFTSTNSTDGSPKDVLQRSLHRNLGEIMGSDDMNATKIMVLYEKLN
ncbi:ICP0-binding domain of ubiquitin-specific protease 7-domain-containing protein, partial [Mycena capillaripes]